MELCVYTYMEIYRIFNKANGKSYIGQTKWTFLERYPQGKWWKWTHSAHLKSAFKRYGEENFEVEILDSSAKTQEELNKLEQFYIEKYSSFIPGGYNLTKGGNYVHPIAKEYELIDKSGNIYKISNLKAFCIKHKLNYGGMLNMVCGCSKSSCGFTLLSNNTTDIYGGKSTGGWTLENIKTQEIVHIKFNCLKSWCAKLNLSYSYIRRLISGETLLCKEWKLEGTEIPENYLERRKYRGIELISPEGQLVTVDNIYKFAKEKGIYRSCLYDLIRGKSFIVKGWRLNLPKETLKQMKDARRKKTKLLEISTGKILEVGSIRQFCLEKGLNLNTMYSMVKRKKIKQYSGYSLPDTDLTNYRPPKKIVYVSLQNENGEIVEGFNPKGIENKFGICTSQSIQDLIKGKFKKVKGWSIVKVKYLNDYYPEINKPPNLIGGFAG